MSFAGFSEDDLKRIKSSEAAPNTGTSYFSPIVTYRIFS